MAVNKIENWLGIFAAFVGALGLLFVAYTALNNDFQVYSIMLWGSGFAASIGIEKLTKLLRLNRRVKQ